MAICYLGIGSNLGDRLKNIRSALKRIWGLKGTKVLKVAKAISSKPVGGPSGQGDYLNSAVKISTSLKPERLLKELQDIECLLGRPRRHSRFTSRTIDLDILFYADMVIKMKDLSVPHPKLFEREFVVKPLLEII